MTEAEWRACRDPRQMLDYHRMKKDPRRLRLLAAACARRIVPADAAPLAFEVLEVVERYADGAADRAEFLAARTAVRTAGKDEPPNQTVLYVLRGLTGDAMEGLTAAIETARPLTGAGGRAAECGLIRCLFGNPYRPTAFDPAWLTSTVLALARGIYDEPAFDRMPILADALMDAGCDDAEVLGHCRGGEPHARGCWVVDGLLGKR
jgi:hypothetical protein